MKIAFLKLCCPGDLLFTTPAVRAIRSHFPDARLYYITGRYSSFIADHNPHVDETIIVAPPFECPGKVSAVANLAKGIDRIARMGPDLLISFHRSRILALLGVFGRAGQILGFSSASPLIDIGVGFDPSRHEVRRYLDLVAALGCGHAGLKLEYMTTPEEDDQADRMLRSTGIDGDFAIVAPGGGQNPGTTMHIKRWPVTGFKSVADHIRYKYNIPVVAVGAASEKELASNVNPDCNLAGKTTFALLASVMKKASIVVGNDSGPLYLASAVGAKTVGVYGPWPDYLTEPLSENHRSVKQPVWCQPCYGPENFSRGVVRCPTGTWACMLTLRPDSVCKAVDDLMAVQKPSVEMLENRK